MKCPLCSRKEELSLYHKEKGRSYFHCSCCSLIFVPPQYHSTPEVEKARYLLHHNSSKDPGYIRFLSRIIPPIIDHVVPGSKGLDFGSGPNPVLADLLKAEGYTVDIYDPYFAPDSSISRKSYDFICATEVVEHFVNPQKEFTLLDKMLNPGGVLAVMTRMAPNQNEFGNWFYIRDITHIVFYTKDTMEWISDRYGWQLREIESDIFLFEKK